MQGHSQRSSLESDELVAEASGDGNLETASDIHGSDLRVPAEWARKYYGI